MLIAPALDVRPFRAADAAFVRRLGRQAFFEFSRTPGTTTVRMAQRYATWIAWRSGLPVGFAIVQHDVAPGLAELAALAVSESARGRGIGYQLLRRAEQEAIEHGAASLRAHSADFNVAALELFLRNGYRIGCRLARYYRDRFDACELIKPLAP